ncbi:MAG: prepilin-type N-terminal cleavage/methylation domain-containing protein [Armatimonadota bacterium]|nr:prepilin-type N-terminal cleavage/methylation domain-containing protein [Armatimonadota bacterium]
MNLRAYRTGFTLIEIIVAMAILAILAAMLLPVLLSSVKQAKKTSCQEKLVQLHRAIELYRIDHQPNSDHGLPAAMGLPPNLATLRIASNLPRELLRCQGVTNRSAGVAFTTLFMVTPELEAEWQAYVAKMGPRTVLILDDNHQQNPNLQNSPFAVHDAFGVNLSGSVERRSSAGHPASFEFWSE